MINIIRKLSIVLLLMMLIPITSFSQTILSTTPKDSIVYITATQLKQTNLIFAEHNKLLTENKLLKQQIYNYQSDIKLLEQSDSLRVKQVNTYKDWNKSLSNSLNRKNKKLLYWKIGGISISAVLLVSLILK